MTNGFYGSTRGLRSSIGAISLAAVFLPSVVYADAWSLGAGVMTEKLAYREYKTQVMPIPIVTYQGKYFYINGLDTGVKVINTDTHRLNINIHYSPLSFKPADSDHSMMKKLDKRRASAMAGVGYQHHAGWGIISGSVATDILGNSDGVLADIGYQYSFKFGKWQLVPGVGVEWQSRLYNDYYFGVSQRESQRSGMSTYRAESASSAYQSFAGYYSVNDNWQLFLMGRYNHLSDTVKDSPMIDRSYSVTAATGVIYKF
ncbi:MltA-interacting protein MipA [Pragia fontium]|uniref:MltA-interacting protein MipA n=1 Tax=Pragia fontium TaxID=82985 RepID=A0ABQ5LJG9_9GAMM|nr:MipA/OmpV family protein [Pragia fontium]AKJ41166.1 hypothetical protein QQ39_02955 [Pragia fontium]GKX63364.1 MltA-interacting protein MipA [Pragia fontium]